MASKRMTAITSQLGELDLDIKKTEIHYPTADGTRMRALLFRPEPLPKDGSPLIVMIHGGGFCLGVPDSEEQTCRSFVQAFGAVCLSISHRLAPEYKFPYTATDCWDALKFAAASAVSWGADPAKGSSIVIDDMSIFGSR